MFIVRIVTYLDRWIELSRTEKSYEKLKDLIVREQFMDAWPEDPAKSLREKDLPTLERIAREANLFLQARYTKLCDQPRRVFQNNARPKMDPVWLIELEKRLNSGQRTGEAKVGVADQRLCFKCKKTGHIARYCTAVDTTMKKAGAGVVLKATEVKTAGMKKPTEGSTMKVTDNLQSEVKDGMLQLASGKSVPVMMNCAALSDPEKTKSLLLPILRGEIGGREVDVMRDTGCEGVVVRRKLVDAGQLTGECCLLLRIDNTALLAEKADINFRTPFLSGEVKALYIPDAICDVIVGNVDGARSPEDPDMSVMVGAATTRAQAKRYAVTKPLRVPDMERHGGVDREQLIKLQQENPRIRELVDADRTSRRGGKVVSFEKARGIVYRRYENPGRNVRVKQVVLPKSLREYVMSVAHDSLTGAHLKIRRTKDKVLSNFYWPGVDCDVIRYCRSCDVCQRTVKKGIVPRVPLEKAQERQKHYCDRTAKCRKFSVGEKVLVLLPTDSNKLLMQWKGPFKVVATVRVNDYRINMGEKVKTFHANLLKVVKKKDGSNRVCIDYRRLNKITTFDPQPMTPPADVFKGMEKDRYFSKLDLSKSYWQIPVRKKDIPNTAFVTMDCHYEFLGMPFGMMNSGATLTRAVKKLLCGMDNVVDYIDDLLVHIETWEAHVETLAELFQRLREANFTVRPVKCVLGSSTIDFLGHRLGQGTISLQDENVEKVRNAPRPKTKKEVRAFLGLVGYYKEFVPIFTAISAPLLDLVREGQPNTVNWTDSQEKAYNFLKFAVTSKPVLQLPDINKRFILRTDPSGRGLGAALIQESDDMLFPVAYASKKLTDREPKYSVIERERLLLSFGE
ncbi:zinc finger protein [Elysia marginata]|uniref:Zinc finger protein n=1 Tax=Elysia marginata TaxID=1093978 RepID=A0AAV4GR51_9GAST|nr:zinc finger protein [Elysia marginata]